MIPLGAGSSGFVLCATITRRLQSTPYWWYVVGD
jgi:hypothetical protein